MTTSGPASVDRQPKGGALQPIKIASRDGRRSASGATAAEAISSYIRQYGDARNLRLAGLNIVDLEVPENTDFSGTEFVRCSISGLVAKKCKFVNGSFRSCAKIVGLDFDESDLTGISIRHCRIRKISAENGVLKSGVIYDSKIDQGDLDFSDMTDMSVEYSVILRSTLREAAFVGSRTHKSHIILSDLYKMDLSSSVNRFSSFRDSDGAFTRWRDATCERVDFSNFKFLPRGRKSSENFYDARSIGRSKLVTYIERLYENANFTGCRYDGARIPKYRTFPADASVQRIARFVARAAFTTAGYIAIESGFDRLRDAGEALVHNPTFLGNVARYVLPHISHVSSSTIGAIGATVLLGASVAADWAKEEGVDMIDDHFVTSLRTGLTVRAEIGSVLHNLSDLVVLVGRRGSLRPVREAILAARKSWPVEKKHGHRPKFRPSYRSLVMDGAEILVCDRASVEAAARVAVRALEMDDPPSHDVTILPAYPNPDGRARIVSAQFGSNRETRLVWRVDSPPCDVVIGWNHAGHIIQESAVPEMHARQLRRMIDRIPEIYSIRGHGLEGAVAALFDGIAGQGGYFADLAAGMQAEQSEEAEVDMEIDDSHSAQIRHSTGEAAGAETRDGESDEAEPVPA